jgi:hypothetical protein
MGNLLGSAPSPASSRHGSFRRTAKSESSCRRMVRIAPRLQISGEGHGRKATKSILPDGVTAFLETPDQMVRRVCRELGNKKNIIINERPIIAIAASPTARMKS